MLLSLIVPCFNEQEVLPLFYKETVEVIKNIGCDYELIFVNDGSKDNTLSVLKDICQRDEKAYFLSFARNFGKEAAMYAGFKNAKGDYIAVIDADLQDPPSLLPKMIEILDSGEYQSVATRRVDRNGEPKVRSWFARKFYKIINKISDADIVDGARDFRLMKREMVEAVIAMTENNRFSKGIFGWIGFKTYWLPFENTPRAAGNTKWSFWKLFKYAVGGIINFSETPLSIASWFGIASTVVSFIMLLIIFIKRLAFGDPVAGWASLICVILFIGGLQLFCIGIVGQYIAKIYTETKNRPHYILSETNIEDIEKIG